MKSPEARSLLRRYGSYMYALNRLPYASLQSDTIGRALGINATQVRRDLSGRGRFGTRGVGYQRDGLALFFAPANNVKVGVYGDMPGIGVLCTAIAEFPRLKLVNDRSPDIAVLMFKSDFDANATQALLRAGGVVDFVNLGDYLLDGADNAAPMHAICQLVGEVYL